MLEKEIPVSEEFVSAMEKKYQEKFEFTELEGSHYGRPERAAYVRCETFPEERVWVRRITAEDGSRNYSDNYMGYVYRERLEAAVKEAAEAAEVDCEAEVSVMESYIPVSSGPEQGFEEMLKEEGTVFSVEITTRQKINEADREMILERFREKLKERKLRLKGIFRDEGKQFCFFAMDESYEFLYADWRQGE